MTPLVDWLATRPGRCPHGFHLELQGCLDCGIAHKFAAQAATSEARPSERAAVDAAIRQLAATHQPFSANDARSIHGVKGGVVGAAFTAAHKAKLIVPCGDEGSTSGSTHGHRIYLWKGTAAA